MYLYSKKFYLNSHSGWFAMTVDSTSFFGPTASLESKPLLRTSPKCQVKFSYYHNQTVGGSTYIGVKVIEDYGVNTTSVVYSDVYQQFVESVDEWRTMYVGIGARPAGMIAFHIFAFRIVFFFLLRIIFAFVEQL